MKSFFALLLCTLILGLSFQDTLIFVSWKINQEYIAQNLCLEKNIKGSSCNGKCQLQEQLKENKCKETNKTPNFQEERVVVVYLPLTKEIETLKISSIRLNSPAIYKEDYSYLLNSQIFHPPQFS